MIVGKEQENSEMNISRSGELQFKKKIEKKKKNTKIIVGPMIAFLVIFLLISVSIIGALLLLRDDHSSLPSSLGITLPSSSSTGSYTVSWSNESGATSYTLEEDDNSLFISPTVVYIGSNTSTDVTGKKNGTYYYRVKATNSYGESDWSPVKFIEVEISVIPGAEVIKINGVDFEFVTISSGSFMMGSTTGDNDEGPVHEVDIGYSFQMGKFEVTQTQWFAVMGTTPWSDRSYVQQEPDNPAVYISWNDCQAFVEALNALDPDHIYRLPSESEWEYCCRAGSDTEYCYGDDSEQLGDYAWYYDNAWYVDEKYAHEVGTKLPNTWGLYDMHGNVWEWCQDWYHSSYYGAPDDGTAWDDEGSHRVGRSGNFCNPAILCRSASRHYFNPGVSDGGIGLRLVRV